MDKMKSIASRVFMAGFLLMWTQNARAASYYVATTGSDSNPGTLASPFLTLQKGVNSAHAGDTIIVRDGTYGGGGATYPVTINTAGTSSAVITLKAEHKGAAILDCQMSCNAYMFFGVSAAYWVIQDFDIRNTFWWGIFSPSVANGGGGSNIVIQGNNINHIGNRVDTSDYGHVGIYTDDGSSYWTINGNVIHDVGRTSGLPGANHDHGIYSHGTNMLITNNVFYNALFGWHIQTAAGFSGTIANNTFFGPAGTLLPGTYGSIILWQNNSNLIIRNNIFYNPLAVGIFTYGFTLSGSCSIDHNFAFNAASSVSLIYPSLPSGCTQSNNSLNTNPLLAVPSLPNYNFHLLAGSPAIDTGAAFSVVPLDFDGLTRPQGAGYDIGAFEYAGTTAVAPPVASTVTTTVALPPGCVVSAGAWQNVSLAAQTGSFTAEFDSTPGMASMDGVSGLSNAAASAYTALAAAVRFNNTGTIDARNGGAYAAAASIPYVSGMSYHFRLVVNLPAHTYSAYVKQGANAEQLIGGSYAFRTEQSAVTTLNNLGLMAASGSMTDCNAVVAAATVITAPPIISAVSVSGIGQTAATIGWTTNVTADSQVVYGLTSAYGSATTLGTALTTSHSVALSGLTAGTVYHYAVKSHDSAGNLATSPDATFTTTAITIAASPVCVTSGGTWQNVSLAAQTGSFTAEFDSTPAMAKMDGVSGLSNGAASAYTALAAIVRFNSTGNIDAVNGGAYAAAASIPYVAGMSYHFRLVVNLSAHTYSAYVKQGANAEQLIGGNYAFRTEQKSVSLLNNLGLFASPGSLADCNAAVHP